MSEYRIIHADVISGLQQLEDESINCCVTSPPYFAQRDYDIEGQIGLEQTPGEYVEKLVQVFKEVKRVLKKDGTLFLNLGDSYVGGGKGNYGTGISTHKGTVAKHPNGNYFKYPGLKNKDLIGIPWLVGFALQKDGWWLRCDIIWDKSGNGFPESVKDRPTKCHEYIFLLTKNAKYYYDSSAIEEAFKSTPKPKKERGSSKSDFRALGKSPQQSSVYGETGKNKRSVWSINTKSYSGAHFATFPEALVEPPILAGCPENGLVLDPFCGSGTTALVALKNNRNFIGIELNADYIELANNRIREFIQKEVELKSASYELDADLFESEQNANLNDLFEFI